MTDYATGHTVESKGAGIPPPNGVKLAYTIPEVIALTGIGRTKLYEEIGEFRLRVIDLAGRPRVLHDDLMAYLGSAPERPKKSRSSRR
jgi:hypothetical protein